MPQLDRVEKTHADPSVKLERVSLYRFLRNSHIFSSAVREILESKYLSETCCDRITLQQFHLLKLISLNGHHQVGEVADFLGVSSPAASKCIDKLERLGLVTRTRSTLDRRVMLLSATKKACDLVNRYEVHKYERLAPLLDKFTWHEIAELTRLLERFSVLLYAREVHETGFCLRCAAYGQHDCPIGQVLGNCPYAKVRGKTHNGHTREDDT